jgi:hypothetical protein
VAEPSANRIPSTIIRAWISTPEENHMLYLLSGASASGKKTVSAIVAERVSDIVRHLESELPATTRQERMANMERWIERAIDYERDGKDLLLPAQSPLGEVLASPRTIELNGIAACVLDCHDHERTRRYAQRPFDPRWPMGMDHLCWAAFHRMHAVDPQFEQRVLRDGTSARYHWDRWTAWQGGDDRWRVELIDDTTQTVSETFGLVTAWIERTRASGAPLRRDASWWE